MLALELDEPRRLACAEQLRRGPLGQIEREPRVLVRGGLTLAGALQPIQGVRPQRFQHSETHVFTAVAAFTANQAVLNQNAQVVIAGHRQRPCLGEPADEHTQRAEQRLVFRTQQVVAPVEGRLQ